MCGQNIEPQYDYFYPLRSFTDLSKFFKNRN